MRKSQTQKTRVPEWKRNRLRMLPCMRIFLNKELKLIPLRPLPLRFICVCVRKWKWNAKHAYDISWKVRLQTGCIFGDDTLKKAKLPIQKCKSCGFFNSYTCRCGSFAFQRLRTRRIPDFREEMKNRIRRYDRISYFLEMATLNGFPTQIRNRMKFLSRSGLTGLEIEDWNVTS